MVAICASIRFGFIPANKAIGEKLPFDVIACGTGFVTVSLANRLRHMLLLGSYSSQDKFPYHLRGRESTIQEFYDKHDGPLAYLGTSVPGFPNFFMINGMISIKSSSAFRRKTQLQYRSKYCYGIHICSVLHRGPGLSNIESI